MPDPVSPLLPINATALERVFDQLVALRLAAIETSCRAFWSAADCPVDLLPWLAWALSIDEWDPAWTEGVRRSQVARAIELQRKKGTVAGVTSIIAGFGGTVALREWWQIDPPGTPHTFELSVALAGTSAAPPAEFIDAIIRAVSAAKPLRSHFIFSVAQGFAGGIGMQGAMRPAVFVRAVIAALTDGATGPAPIIPATALTLSAELITLDGDYLTLS